MLRQSQARFLDGKYTVALQRRLVPDPQEDTTVIVVLIVSRSQACLKLGKYDSVLSFIYAAGVVIKLCFIDIV